MNKFIILIAFLIFMGLAEKTHKLGRNSHHDSRKHFEILPIVDLSSSLSKISKISTLETSSNSSCTNLSTNCMRNQTCFEYLYYCSILCPAGQTTNSTLNEEIESYCLLNCLWRNRNVSTLLESYLECLINGSSLEILYEDCFNYWDTCTNSTECLVTFTDCDSAECYQENTVAEETYECFEEAESNEDDLL